MTYRALAESLRAVADAAEKHFRNDLGLGVFSVEDEIHPEVPRPTLHAATRDHHLLCLEVSEQPYPNTLDRLVLDCVRVGLPVRLFVVVPKPGEPPPSNYVRDLQRARENGVGVVEVDGKSVKIINQPVSLSLLGLRKIDRNVFPRKYRECLARAESTFLQGNPPKGCSEVYDEIESITRRIAKQTEKKGWWAKSPGFDFSKENWTNVIKTMMRHLDYKKAAPITESLLARVLGITSQRNEAGHKPKSKKEQIKRDKEMRTRFETAVDVLLELVEGAKSLRV